MVAALEWIILEPMVDRDSATDNTSPTATLFARVYDELRSIAEGIMVGERGDHTLSPTALVNEAYVRLSRSADWQSNGHFFAAAVETMRRVLVDHARMRRASKRNGTRAACNLDCLTPQRASQDVDLLLDFDALLERLGEEDPEAAQLVTLRIFAGLSVVQAGEKLGLSRWSAYQLWSFCQAWFAARTQPTEDSR